MKALSGTIIVRPTARHGIRKCRRGEVTHVGEKVDGISVGDCILFNGSLSEALQDGLFVIKLPKVAVMAIDARTDLPEVHECFGGIETPGAKGECAACQIGEGSTLTLRDERTDAERLLQKSNQKEFPPGLLNAIADGKITPEQARDDYGVPIQGDILRGAI